MALFSVLGVVGLLLLLTVAAILLFLVRRRRAFTPKQPLTAPAQEEKRPLNGAPAIDFVHRGGVSPRHNRRPPEPSISVIRHA